MNYLNAAKAWEESTGEGVTVAVIDDGVDGSHPDLKRNVLNGRNFTGSAGEANAETKNDHGTAMAGLIAAHGSGADGEN
ncbi:S8 family serine peptidase [Streptomyces sp. P38-E01]|uniref:S8 family serine peptidase n=1 Tax=Streptomyces tardus TaxID=2780544 RepID=A0A949N000_9ACTN|nr:S8 family serine peptidase [Streptomyces tardus]